MDLFGGVGFTADGQYAAFGVNASIGTAPATGTWSISSVRLSDGAILKTAT